MLAVIDAAEELAIAVIEYNEGKRDKPIGTPLYAKILRLRSALQSVEGGVQGSSADGQHCNEQFGRGLSPAFGIIDPDYARIFTIARCVAWAEGYAIAMHGSFTRDLDLIAVPWARHACEPEHLARRIESAAGLKISVHPKNDKPFGRLVWTMTLPNFGDPRFVDLSIIPRSSIEQDGQAELLEEEQRMIDLAWETHKAARPIDASTLAEEIRIQMNVRKTCVVSGVEALAKGLIEAFTITQLTKIPSAGHDDGNLRGLAEPNHHQPHALSQVAVELGKLLSASRTVHEWLSNWDLPFQDDDEWGPDLVAFCNAMNDATFEYVRAMKAVAETDRTAPENAGHLGGVPSAPDHTTMEERG
ncbi:MAG TPA: hypothetical protein PLZ37_06505 [Nitrospira sp.]|nr:hypothetical protein [Nitrospira sp.]